MDKKFITRGREIYNMLVENEDLGILFENMTGVWSVDKNEFLENYAQVETFLDEIYKPHEVE